MKASEILRDAIEVLQTRELDRCLGLCFSLDLAVHHKHRRSARARVAASRVKAIIQIDLQPASWLQTWLIAQRHATPAEIGPGATVGQEKLRATRIAWAEDLIRYFESKGD